MFAALSGCDVPTNASGDGDVATAFFGEDEVIWFTESAEGAWTMPPLVHDSIVYFERDVHWVGDEITELYQLSALDRNTGEVLWQQPTRSARNAAVAGEAVAAIQGSLPIYRQSDGDQVGHYRSSTSLGTNVESDGERFYFGDNDGRVAAVDARGAVVWDTAVGGLRSVDGLALAGGRLAVVGLRTEFSTTEYADTLGVAAVDAATGVELWRAVYVFSGWGRMSDLPRTALGAVIVATSDYHILAYDLATGALRWNRHILFKDDVDSRGLTTCDGMVLAATGDRGVIALDATTGATVWHRGDISRYSINDLDCSHGTFFLRNGYVQVRDAASGALIVEYPAGTPPPERTGFIWAAGRDEEAYYIGFDWGWAKVKAR